jgi:hypothetical protein
MNTLQEDLRAFLLTSGAKVWSRLLNIYQNEKNFEN